MTSLPTDGIINWSKVPFESLETNGRLSARTQKTIVNNFESYIAKIQRLGYDSISIDDLAHMAQLPVYPDNLQLLLNDYRSLYKQLFAIASSQSLRIFVNTDYLFSNQVIDDYIAANKLTPEQFFTQTIEQVIADFPEIDGIILRIGENDGQDVSDAFLSTLTLRTPQQANHLLHTLLPLFEQRKKTLIFRTWTVGAYAIGDLIWNSKTYDAVFSDITSDALIISMKYGDTDFMRHLALNPLLLHGPHKKIVELQTRREWEGMGTMASFVGWDYMEYLQQLHTNDSVVGIHVWCQTGGWAKAAWSNITYGQNSSFWNELNTEITIAITRHGASVEAAIESFCKARGITDVASFTELLTLSEIAIKNGLYVADIATRPLYFRRTRIPPLLWITWDKIHLPAIVISIHQLLLTRSNHFIADGDEAVRASKQMADIAHTIALPKPVITSLHFQHDTLDILATLRRHVLHGLPPDELTALNERIQQYTTTYPQHYTIEPLSPTPIRRIPKSLVNLFVRDTQPYRMRDKVVLKTSSIQAKVVAMYLKRTRSHLATQSMGLGTLFK